MQGIAKRTQTWHVSSQILTGLIPFIAIPYLVGVLKDQQFIVYGVINSLTALLILADLGLGVYVFEKAAFLKVKKNRALYKRQLGVSYTYYLIVGGTIFFLFLISSDAVMGYFVTTALVGLDSCFLYLSLTISFRVLNIFYRQCLFGLGCYDSTNTLAFFATLLRFHSLLYLDLESSNGFRQFCAFYFYVSLFESVFYMHRVSAIEKIRPVVNLHELKGLLLFGSTLFLTGISSKLIQYLDRIVAPPLLGDAEFSLYLAALSLSNSVFMVLTPLNTLFNRKMYLTNSNDIDGKRLLALISFMSLISFVVVISIPLVYFLGDTIFGYWFSDKYNSGARQITLLLIAGNLFFFVYGLLFYFSFARQKIDKFLIANIYSIIIALCAYYFFFSKYFTVGIALAWLVINVVRVLIIAPTLVLNGVAYTRLYLGEACMLLILLLIVVIL